MGNDRLEERDTFVGTLLIGDAAENVVQVLDLMTGKYISTHFGPGTGPGQFNGPSGIDEARNRDVYKLATFTTIVSRCSTRT